MTTNIANAKKRTGSTVRPGTIFLGVDNFGSHHVYRRDTDTVHVIAVKRNEREAVIDADGRRLEGWMADIAASRGWMSPDYGIQTVDFSQFSP